MYDRDPARRWDKKKLKYLKKVEKQKREPKRYPGNPKQLPNADDPRTDLKDSTSVGPLRNHRGGKTWLSGKYRRS